ncbi:hypothetical protein Hanom_Chr14g01247531 [Helianthus anomalus]
MDSDGTPNMLLGGNTLSSIAIILYSKSQNFIQQSRTNYCSRKICKNRDNRKKYNINSQ